MPPQVQKKEEAKESKSLGEWFVDTSQELQRKYNALFLVGRVYLWLVVFESLVAVIVHAILIVDPITTSNQRVAMVLVFVNVVFFLYFAFDGILNANMFEVGACLFMSFMLLAFAAYNYVVGPSEADALRISFLSLTVLVQLVYVYLSWQLYLQIGWQQFKKVSPKPQIRSMYRFAQMTLTMVKVDVVYALLLIIIAGFFLLAPDDYELYVVIVALFLQTAWGWGGWKAIKEENPRYIYYFWAYALMEPLYIIGKLMNFFVLQVKKYENTPRALFLVLGVAALIIRGIIYALSYRCLKNFKQGLKSEYFDRDPEERGNLGGKSTKKRGGSQRGRSTRSARSSKV